MIVQKPLQLYICVNQGWCANIPFLFFGYYRFLLNSNMFQKCSYIRIFSNTFLRKKEVFVLTLIPPKLFLRHTCHNIYSTSIYPSAHKNKINVPYICIVYHLIVSTVWNITVQEKRILTVNLVCMFDTFYLGTQILMFNVDLWLLKFAKQAYDILF